MLGPNVDRGEVTPSAAANPSNDYAQLGVVRRLNAVVFWKSLTMGPPLSPEQDPTPSSS